MKALCWEGVESLAVREMPDPSILDPGDAIVRVRASSVCGSDLHLINGYVPAMRKGDIIGHEFMGEIVDVGSQPNGLAPGDRVVVGSVVSCGGCWYCRTEQFSLCDNSNPQPVLAEKMWGHSPAGILGYSHALGGFAGSHAEYVRVPFASVGSFKVPEGLADDAVVFASDALPTGWMAAEMCNLRGGEAVAVWGAGAVGQMAARAAQLLGAGRVIMIDRIEQRLTMASEKLGVDTLNYDRIDVLDALREMTGGRGPDACIEAVGMESHGEGVVGAYDKMRHTLRMQTDRPTAVREAIMACRKGGTVSIVGVFAGVVDKFPLGAAMNKALILRMGQMHAQRYIPMLLDRLAAGEIDPSYLTTHPMSLADGAQAYKLFETKDDGCVRAVLHP